MEDGPAKRSLWEIVEKLVAYDTDLVFDIEKIYPELNPDK
jgi:hypothetical protein